MADPAGSTWPSVLVFQHVVELTQSPIDRHLPFWFSPRRDRKAALKLSAAARLRLVREAHLRPCDERFIDVPRCTILPCSIPG